MLIRRRGGRQPLAAEESRSLAAEEPGGFLFDERLLTLVFWLSFSLSAGLVLLAGIG